MARRLVSTNLAARLQLSAGSHLRHAGSVNELSAFYITWGDAMNQEEQDYLLARAAQERALAEESSDEIVREIHLKLALEYSRRAQDGHSDDRPGDHVFAATSVGDRSS